MNHAARALATLRRLGPMTASELMHATGVSSTTLRRYLLPPRVIVVWEKGKGRERAKVYGVTKVFCDCGQPAAYRLPVGTLSADGKAQAQALDLCVACAKLIAGKERDNLRAIIYVF